jgi:hypothetical protein
MRLAKTLKSSRLRTNPAIIIKTDNARVKIMGPFKSMDICLLFCSVQIATTTGKTNKIPKFDNSRLTEEV